MIRGEPEPPEAQKGTWGSDYHLCTYEVTHWFFFALAVKLYLTLLQLHGL